MKKITITISIDPLKEGNLSERSKSNKIGNDMINKVTEALNNIDTSNILFDVNISTE